MEIRPGSRADLDVILSWLKAEEVAGSRGFYCNRKVIEKALADSELDVLFVDGFPAAFFAYGLTYSGILETHPDYRRRGLGKMMAEHALLAAIRSDVRCVLEFQCAPESSVPFWKEMGFTIFEEYHRTIAYMVLEKNNVLPEGDPVDVVIQQHWTPDQHKGGHKPAWVATPQAVRTIDGAIHLSKRSVFPEQQAYYSGDRRDPVAKVVVDGRVILFDKVRYAEAKAVGMKYDRYGVGNLDTIFGTSAVRPTAS